MKLEELGLREEQGFEDIMVESTGLNDERIMIKGKRSITVRVRQSFMNDKEADWLLSNNKGLKFAPYRQGLGRKGQGTHLAVIINGDRFIVSKEQIDRFDAKKAAEKKAAEKKADARKSEAVADKPKG